MSFETDNHDAREQIRQSINIVDLVGSYLQLRRKGPLYVALCPWHNDSNPSLQVNPQRQSWKCWVCDVGGDIYSFVMQHEGVTFPEAMRILADRAGIQLGPARKRAAPGSPEDKATLFRATEWAQQQFHACLLHSSEAQASREYLRERGIQPETIETFQLGYSPNQWQWLLEKAKTTEFSEAVLEAAGLVKRGERGRCYDLFRDRVLFTIRDTQRRPIAFGGRILPGADTSRPAPKYVNSPETRLFSKSEQLYGLDVALPSINQRRQVLVMEGYTDVILAHQAGITNAVAVLGVALGARHIRNLQRLADSIVLVLDGDDAGRARAEQILELFVAADMDLRILTLPEGLDPCDFVQQRGADAFREAIEAAPDAMDHRIEQRTRGIDINRDTHRAHNALEDILQTMAGAPSPGQAMRQSRWLRDQQLLSRLSRQYRLPEADLRSRLEEMRGAPKRGGWNEPDRAAAESRPLTPMTPFERELLEILTQHPELVERAASCVGIGDLPTTTAQQIFQVYLDFFQQRGIPEFTELVSQIEDSAIKNMLVTLDEQASDKEEKCQEDPAQRLEDLVDGFRGRASQERRRLQQSELETQSLDEHKELEVLESLLREERQRQGISPTDG